MLRRCWEERQRAERERERAAAQIALEARAEAERANRAKSEFLSRMSHELRTPLNAVLGFGQLLQMGSLDKRQAESVDQIVKGGRHLLDLIDEVLDISRIESGGLALSMESVDVAGLLGDVLALVKPMAAERGIELRAELQETTGRYVAADEQRLKQVLLNLLSNATKYNCDDGAVTVTCDELAGERLRILVSDTGPGIAADKLDRVFTPFDRLGAERTTVEGTGLGLALSKRLTEAMGGNLTVESGPERGSAFAVELPLAEPPAPQHPGRVTNGQSDGARFGRRSLLYIEDNPSNFKLIEKLFESQGEVEVELAMQGELGIELAQQHRPDVIVLDLHLPDMSGAEVLARLQGEPRTADLPVIVLTADASPGQEERLRQAGARAYLTKPLDVQRFLAVVNDCLVDREASRSSERSASPRGDASPVISR